ncbi:MAG: DUF2400 family protein [Euryarchaeota archaeon]|nr:DUF2400 family protein [Euryarchaeota archaeon]MDE1835539.1 DUF2400 family protein [Euryarchaeota archaeon]MDE2043839.1 DUF2400 family protein [Thermoplasmata archaeon]
MHRTRPSPSLGSHLGSLASHFPYERSLPQDPLAMVRPFAADARSAEIAGILASTVAVGNVKAIRRALVILFDRMGESPRRYIEGFPARRWRIALHPWQHRWIRADQIGFLCVRLQEIYARYPGGLEEVVLRGMAEAGELAAPEEKCAHGLHALSEALRWGSVDRAPTVFEPPPGYLRLFPSPLGPGEPACKREALFLRWMVRRGFPDLGLWKSVAPSDLQIPLDTHVYWIAYHLGLTRRRTRNWRTVVEITRGLRRFDAQDPVRFDFVLAHTGISGDCPKRRDPEVCAPCAVRADCDLWRGRRILFSAPPRCPPANAPAPAVSNRSRVAA